MNSLPKELEEKIIDWIKKQHRLEIDWDYKDTISEKQLKDICEKGLDEFVYDLCDLNLDTFYDLEIERAKEIFEEFQDELSVGIETIQHSYFESDIIQEVYSEIRDHFLEYLPVHPNHERLLKDQKVTVLFEFHNDYDCSNSSDFIAEDMFDNETYLGNVWEKIKEAVLDVGFISEHNNSGSASLFCFASQFDLMDYLELKEKYKNEEEYHFIKFPQGTQYGFFGSLFGNGSQFGHYTVKDLVLPMKWKNENSCIICVADLENSYNIEDVYGSSDFITESEITILKEREEEEEYT